MKHFFMYLVFGFFVLLIADQAHAKDLVDAAQSAQTMFNRIGIAAIGIGITLGGVLFAFGAAQLGRNVLISGLVGAVCILGGPGIISLLGRVFGVSL